MDKQTQEALKRAIGFAETSSSISGELYYQYRDVVISACKEALKQSAQDTETMAVAIALQEHIRQLKEQPAQEPVDVARVQVDGSVEWRPDLPDLPVGTKLYTHPHQWQGLTDDVVASIWMHEAVPMNGQDFKRVYRAIEQALRIKNGT